MERLALHVLSWTLMDVECTAAHVEYACTKELLSSNVLILLQVRRSAEVAGGRRNLTKAIAEEEAQLDAMAADMMVSEEQMTPPVSGLDHVELTHPGFQTSPGVYEARLEPAHPLDGGPNNMLVNAPHAFAPLSFSQATAAIVTTAPAVTSLSSGDQAGVDSCSPECEQGHGICRNAICLCKTPYIGEACRDIDLRAIKQLAAVRGVKMLTSDPAKVFLLLEEVPIVLAMLVVTLCVVAAVLLATFFAHVYLKINEGNDDTFGAEEAWAQEDFHEAWWHSRKKHAGAS